MLPAPPSFFPQYQDPQEDVWYAIGGSVHDTVTGGSDGFYGLCQVVKGMRAVMDALKDNLVTNPPRIGTADSTSPVTQTAYHITINPIRTYRDLVDNGFLDPDTINESALDDEAPPHLIDSLCKG